MRFNDVAFPNRPPIEGYGSGGFRIGGYAHRGGLLILPGRVGEWTPGDPLRPEDFEAALDAAGELDVLLVGMGAEIAHLPAPVRAALEAGGVNADVMATPAACRTYNVLIAEDRRVGALLRPV